ncbi:MAG TPA: molybdopterin cofactor-binding domain-containing protein [Streptosporangiaceae bacterium]|nr:molybdopterin cofactor-binding domain-containing protein [Streptosporangiaceae bacterium]
MDAEFTVNGVPRQVAGAGERTLLEVLRDDLGITGPKYGCGEGECGACTVLIGRRAVQACSTPAREAAGQRITTVEGLAEDGMLHPVQQAWLETRAMQCGYCTPGWLTATAALLAQLPHPDDERIDAALRGHVCRCCTYPRIRRAVHRAAELMEHPEELLPVPAGTDAASAAGSLDNLDSLPLDRAPRTAESFFAALPDGLVAVAEDDPAGGGWSTSTDAWVHVAADGTVTAFTGKVDGGQGTRSALGTVVAEQLAVPASQVRVVMGNTSVSPFDMGTFGSRSMPDAAPRLRRAAAGACRVLHEAAAQRFGIPPASLSAAGGVVAGPDGAPAASYGELLTGVRRVEMVPADEPVSPRSGPGAARPAQETGAARPAQETGAAAADAVTGRKRFPADLSLPGMLHGCVLRPPAYGARLRTADLTAAEALPGVTVLREDDFIGAVAAERRAAQQAVEAVSCEWAAGPQPDRAQLEAYLREHPADGVGWGAPFRDTAGDVDTALAQAATRLTATYRAAYIAHVPLEPRSALARWADGRLTVWVGSSTPFRARSELADALHVAEQDIQVIVPDYGGGFGGKHGATVALEAARLARAAARPVKVAWTREDEFRWGYLRPAAVIDVSSGVDASGMLTGWSFTNINSGQAGILTPYRIPHRRIAYQPALSPLPQGSYRALAATANHFARESHMDELALRLGEDPLEFRLRHLDDDRLAEVFRTAADRIGWQRTGGGTADGAVTGTGIAGGLEKDGRVATAARVRVDARTVTVERLVTAFDCGAIVSPADLANQVEGGTVMGLGGALLEEIDFAAGRIRNASLAEYRLPRLPDVGEVEVILIDRPEQPSAGGGEAPIMAVAPAIANAIADACGVRLRAMPLRLP